MRAVATLIVQPTNLSQRDHNAHDDIPKFPNITNGHSGKQIKTLFRVLNDSFTLRETRHRMSRQMSLLVLSLFGFGFVEGHAGQGATVGFTVVL